MTDKNPNQIEAFRHWMGQLMEAKGLNKTDLARYAGVTPQAVNGWFLRGEISKPAAMKISEKTNISIDWLIHGGPELHELNEGRIAKLKAWIDQNGYPEKEKVTFEKLINGQLPFSDKAARRIEVDYGLAAYYLDENPQNPKPPKLSHEDSELLYYFHQLTSKSKEDFLQKIKEKAKFFAEMYDELSEIKKLK